MEARNLTVYLNKCYVGMLTQLLDGRTVFAFDEEYLKDAQRPTLSLSYKNVFRDMESVRDIISSSGKLPPFFSNLLPEGQLRTFLASQADVSEAQEFLLLSALCEDLPGAITLQTVENTALPSLSDAERQTAEKRSATGPLCFSLAGVQFKFSARLMNSKIVIPARGVGGNWILKFPSPVYPHLNELEFSMLRLASEIGITVPEFRLMPMSNLDNLPKNLPAMSEGSCLISKRFDRTDDGGRIHMEDFAQVFSIYEKYDEKYNYESIANVLWLETGLDDVLEFVRRLVHTFAIGTADMHMKNWSLIYADGRQARLSPAYDLVPTIVYPYISRILPHKMAGIKDFNRIGIDAFKKFAQIAKLPERAVLKTASETAGALRVAWTKLRDELPISDTDRRLIEDHMKTIPLLNKT
jgi:serine/threonine-protein kinase HipA